MKKIAVISLSVIIVISALGSCMHYARRCDYAKGAVIQARERRRCEALDKKQALAKRKAAWKVLKSGIEREIRSLNGNVGLVVKDLDMNWEIVCNKDLPIPSASIVKIPIMLSYFYAEKEGRVRLSGKIKLKRSDKTDGSGLLKNAAAGSEYSIRDLLYMMISYSDNTAANMLIDTLGVDKLNAYFRRMGLKHTNLSRKMMDFKARKKGVENYTTARDMAYIMEQLYRGKFLNKNVSRQALNILASQYIKDRIPKMLPSETIVAHKTGLENGLCHDVGIVYTDKGNFLITALTKHPYKSARPMKGLIARISLLTYNYYKSL
ncbi:MAG: serine hydrolase [Candidatus Omnitrophota bacterium]|jgi:beta-lactamase class A